MLELRKYSYSEIAAVLGTKAIQGITRKLKNYNINHSVIGKGKNAVFDLLSFDNEFKVFCILDLGFAAQTKFDKLKYFVFYLFNDINGFCCTTQEEKCNLLAEHFNTSRPTIAKYMKKFEASGFIHIDKYNCKYFAVKGGEKTEIEHKKYSAAWKGYFEALSNGEGKKAAISLMKSIAGGWAIKVPKAEMNAFYIKSMEYLLKLAIDEIEKDCQT